MLDFEKLSNRLAHTNCKQSITILMYSKKNEEYIFHSEGDYSELITHLKDNRASGKVGEVYYKSSFILVAIGNTDENNIVLRINITKAISSVHNILFDESEVIFADSPYTEDAIYGFVISSYKYDFLKATKDDKKFHLNAPKYEKIIKIANAQNYARCLGDTPANLMTPTLFVEYAKKLLAGENVEIHAYDKEFISGKNMNLMLSVAQGSAEEPSFYISGILEGTTLRWI